MREWQSLVGQRIGKLVVEEQADSTDSGQRRWLCRCDCGNTCIATTGNLNRGRTTNFGCKKPTVQKWMEGACFISIKFGTKKLKKRRI